MECTQTLMEAHSLHSPPLKNLQILGLQLRDKAAMLVVNTKETFLLNLHQNRVHLPAEGNAFVLDPQHGHRDVTCKPAITTNTPSETPATRLDSPVMIRL